MPDSTLSLWPYGKRSALLAAPLIWLIAGILLAVANQYWGWPNAGTAKLLVPAVMLVGLAPLTLVVIEFLARRRALLDIKGVKIDFGPRAGATPAFSLPDNIGIPGTVVIDSSPMKILDTLALAIQCEVAVVDLKEGDAWWVSRLLALCAGAVRSRHPAAIVFTGMHEGSAGAYLGWAEPRALLTALLKDNDQYASAYRRAEAITLQLAAFQGTELMPGMGATTLDPHFEVARYAFDQDSDYLKLGLAAFEQVLLDQLALNHENPPDRLTLGRLQHLFGHCLRRETIDLGEPGDRQIIAMLRAKADYIGLIKHGHYAGLLKTDTGQRALLEHLFSRANRGPGEDG